MLCHSKFSRAVLNLKFCCHLKSSVFSDAPVQQLVVARSIHFLSFQNVFSEKNRLSSEVVFTRNIRQRKRVDPPTDFLPINWERSKKFCYIEGSGDNVRTLDVDPKFCKWDVDLTKLLQDLDDDNVRKLFSVETTTKADLVHVNKQLLLKKVQQHPLDFDSREVKIALRTLLVRSLLWHWETAPQKRKKQAKVILIQSIQRRNKLLKELRRVDLPRFEWIVKELSIEYKATLPGYVPDRYTRKSELRRLTKEYCEKMVNEKRDEYHAKLKEQQELFLKEKEEILAWIAKEEEELGISKSEKSPVS